MIEAFIDENGELYVKHGDATYNVYRNHNNNFWEVLDCTHEHMSHGPLDDMYKCHRRLWYILNRERIEESSGKLHLVSIIFKGNCFPLFVKRDRNDTKVVVSLKEFREAYPNLDIRDGDTFSIG